MEQMADNRLRLFENLSINSGLARTRMGLALSDAARLFGVEQSIIEGIERGENRDVPIEILLRLARGLGLTQVGLPREKPIGSL
ncbi:helix-turn-helix domain-containing protein [Methylobacterium sp. E-016]|nr:helix-turn-helix domain-containing protein [Methylobacterium sp. E-016]